MHQLSEADRYLLDEIRRGSADGWTRLVERYQGRLLAFARAKLKRDSDAEDLVQETFISFLRGLPQFRGDAGLETYLFLILRRRIISSYRGRDAAVYELQDASLTSCGCDAADALPAPDPTASWYARRDEEQSGQARALAQALGEYAGHLQETLNFRDLEIAELVFCSQLRNTEIASRVGTSEAQVALIKHRAIARIRDRVRELLTAAGQGTQAFDPPDALLSETWRDQRPSCPKRSTIGAYLLGTLEPEWQEYVTFHLDRLGCAFCVANAEDLRQQTRNDHAGTFRDRILQSTVGFLRPA